MGNRAVITLENDDKVLHPVTLYVQWNGGLESVLAFITYTWDTFDRGRDDLYTFHARLCQVIGNYFPDGLCLYGHPVSDVDSWDCDNGRWHFRIGKQDFELLNRPDELAAAKTHQYWTDTPSIFDSIKEHMPQTDKIETLTTALMMAQAELRIYDHMANSQDIDTTKTLATIDAALKGGA